MTLKYLKKLAFLCLTLTFVAACATQPSGGSSAKATTEVTSISAPNSQTMVEPTRSGSKTTLALGQEISIQNDFGDVRLRFGGYAHQLELSAVAQAPEGAEVPVMRFDAASGLVNTMLINKSAPVRGQRIDVVAFIPEGHNVSVQTLSGLVEVRGQHGNVRIRSNSGDISARGVKGALDAQTGSGAIEVAFVDSVKVAEQRVVTSTGQIIASFGVGANVSLSLATTGLFATEFSTTVTPKPGEEPNKIASAKLGDGSNHIEISSKRGELRLYLRKDFVEVES
jgi:hypothetical protein